MHSLQNITYPLAEADIRSIVRDALALDSPSLHTHKVQGGVLYTRSSDALEGPCVCTIGAFDGVHVGHESLIRAGIADAAERGAKTVCVTFDPDPARVVRPDVHGMELLCVADRVARIAALGVDAVLVLDFVDELRNSNYEGFVRNYLLSNLELVAIHVGSDFRLGKGRDGDVDALAKLGQELGFSVVGEPLVDMTGATITATRIRGLLADGQLIQANELLGRCHFVRGTVQHGRGEGTGFGFPTANVVSSLETCMPKEGVYACYLVVDDTAWPAAANVGAPPSFSDPIPAFLEANLIGFSGDIYNREVSVVFVEYLRPSKKFDSFDELKAAVLDNIQWTRINLGESGVSLLS